MQNTLFVVTITLLACGQVASLARAQQHASTARFVRTVAVVQGPVIRKTTQPATVHAYYRAEIDTRVSGYVRRTLVDIGDGVKAGDALAEIDAPELVQKVAVAQSTVASAVAQVERSEAEVTLAEAQLADARAGVAEAKSRIAAATASLTTAEAELSRTESMVARRAVEQRLLDEARGRRDVAAANAEAARAVVTKAESRVAVYRAAVVVAQAELKAVQAALKVAEAKRDEARVQLNFCRLTAPFAGVVTHRDIDPGDLVHSSQSSERKQLFVVTQIDRVRVRTSVPEGDASLVDVGDEATVALATPGLAPVRARVSRFSRALDPSTRTMVVEIEVENKRGKLLPGMYGEATIVLHKNADALSLPASAVRFSETGESFVYRVDNAGKVSVVNVALGADNGKSIEMVSPLTAGQRVIDAHLHRFQDGEVVRVLD